MGDREKMLLMFLGATISIYDIVAGCIMLSGRGGALLLPGYRKMPQREKDRHDLKTIGKTPGIIMLISAAVTAGTFAAVYFENRWLVLIGFALLIVGPVMSNKLVGKSSEKRK